MRLLLSGTQGLASKRSYGCLPAEPIAAAPRILIVDDDIDIADLFTEFLRLHLKDVRLHANDGIEACAITQQLTPDIVFLDIMMPGIQGDAICRLLRRKTHLKQIPTIGISGNSGPEQIEKLKACGERKL